MELPPPPASPSTNASTVSSCSAAHEINTNPGRPSTQQLHANVSSASLTPSIQAGPQTTTAVAGNSSASKPSAPSSTSIQPPHPSKIPEDSSPTQMLNKTKNVPIAALPQEKQLSETPTVPTPTNLYGNISLLTPQILSAPPLKPTLIASVTKDPLPEPKNPNLRTNTESFPILLTPLSSIPTINSSNEKNIPPYSRTPYLPPSSRRLR